MTPDSNPEKQVKAHRGPITGMTRLLFDHEFGIFHAYDGPPAIRDIGRKWMVDNGWAKEGVKARFIRWEKTNNEME